MGVSGHIIGITINGTSAVRKAYYNNQLVFENDADVLDPKSEGTYVTFQSTAPFTLYKSKNWHGSMYYSTNKVAWYSYEAGMTMTAAKQSNGYYEVYMRGVGNTQLTGMSGNGFSYTGDAKYSVIGNLLLLADYFKVSAGEEPTLDTYACYQLFYGDTKLERVIGSTFTSYCFSDYCFWKMFAGCTSLVEIPVLNITVIGDGTLREMFSECTSLETIPQATFDFKSVGQAGCYRMFYLCKSLKAAPAFTNTQTVLKASALNGMYEACWALTKTPTTINVAMCYKYALANMFRSCLGLTTAANITFSATVEDHVCYSMYEGCAALTEPGSITVTRTAGAGEYEFALMYKNCGRLTKLPTLSGVSFKTAYMCYEMFYGCSLRQIYHIADLQPYTYDYATDNLVLPEYIFSRMFYENTQIEIEAAGKLSNAYVFTDTICSASSTSFADFIRDVTIEPNTTYSTNVEVVDITEGV